MCVCVFAERQNHARELLREVDLSLWDAVVVMSGDGLLFEVGQQLSFQHKQGREVSNQK